jgi:hypothetical protein
MALGFTALRAETLRLLNETNTSVIGELSSGVGGTFESSSDNAILTYVNEAALEMCRSCVFLESNITIASTTSRLNSTLSTIMWYPMSVSTAAARLVHCGEMELQAYDQSYVATTGTPVNWYRNGVYNIGLYPTPTTAVTLTVTGATTPTTISYTGVTGYVNATVAIGTATITGTNIFAANQAVVFRTSTVTNIVAGTTYYVIATGLSTTGFQISASVGGGAITPTGGTGGIFSVEAVPTDVGTYSFLPDDSLLKALPSYAASKLALKNYDDPSLIGRAFWKDWYDLTRMTLWASLDASYKAPGGLFAIPPVPQAGK